MHPDVIIIDSGVNNLLKSKVWGGINLSGIGNKDDIHDSIGHGSSVLNLIIAHKPDALVYMIKVCDNYNGFSFERLCAALEHIIVSNIVCKILNISMGIIRLDNYARLHDLIVTIKNKGIVIVSAYQNQGVISYPAGFDEVIGVDCSPNCYKRNEFEYVNGGIVDVRASSAFYHTFDSKQNKILSKGTSYATANLTGLLLKNMNDYTGTNYCERCLNYLKNNSINSSSSFFEPHSQSNIYDDQNAESNSFVITKWSPSIISNKRLKAIVFPFNKEMHSLARFESMLEVEVVGYYDYRISVNINKKISDVLGCNCSDKTIKPIDECEWNSDFELVICGHCGELSMITKNDILGQIISKCVEFNKTLYSFDNPFGHLKKYPNYDIRHVFFPYIDKSMLAQNMFGKLRNASKPVLGVYGTSSRQGKHTLQLYLRRSMIKKGYKVGQIGTEPHGYIFGFDFVYPMGYNSSVMVEGYDAISILNEAIWNIERNNPDIIITGCQSGTIPYNINYFSNINFSSIEFYLGTAPDAVVLCVNAFDNMYYIEKTIKFLEGLGNAKVIVLALFPVAQNVELFGFNKDIMLDYEDLERIRNDFEQNLGIPTYVNIEENADKICDKVVEFFGG